MNLVDFIIVSIVISTLVLITHFNFTKKEENKCANCPYSNCKKT